MTLKAGNDKLKAKINLSAAAAVNFLYVIPIQEWFGYQVSAVKPFYTLRDKLYNNAIAYYPQGDCEREMWWFLIRFSEFESVESFAITKYGREDGIDMAKEREFNAWLDEIYSHIEPFATLHCENKELEETKLIKLVALLHAYHYHENSMLINKKLKLEAKEGKKHSYRSPLFTNESVMKKYIKAFDLYLEYKDYCIKNDQSQIKYAQRAKLYYQMPTIEMVMSRNIMLNKILHNDLKCNDPLLKVYGDARNILEDMYDRTSSEIGISKTYLSVILGPDNETIKIFSMCPTNSNLKSLHKTMKEVFNPFYDKEYSSRVKFFDNVYTGLMEK